MRQTIIALLCLAALGAALFGLARGEDAPALPPAEAGYQPDLFDATRALALTETLAADALMGRRTGTPGGDAARDLLIRHMGEIGLEPIGDSFAHPFTYGDFSEGAPRQTGTNLIARIEGRSETDLALILTAHYDHLGTQEGEIFNGADDNASGVAALFAIAEHFLARPPEHDVYVVALDAEEQGLGGALAFLADPPLPREAIAFNLNLDMLSKSAAGELYVAGTHHTPELIPLVEGIAAEAPVSLLIGYDVPDHPTRDDWTFMSDHAVFHRAGIPFLYLGVEDHPEYHQPTDVFETIPRDFFLAAIDTAISLAEAVDAELSEIAAIER